ncbi:MAG TPA: O-antigen ligase family protein [Candidatus Moranbacteria bacterium]|nr:O-antigen ligase family protein [Candidatus Moranbacteria bacterium]
MFIKSLIYLIIFSTPLYLVHFSIFKIPTNLLEILIMLTFFIVLINFFKEKNNFSTFNIISLRQFKKISILPKETLFFIGSLLLILFGLIISTLISDNNPQSWGIIKSWFIIPILFGFLIKNNIKTISEKLFLLKIIFYSSGIVSIISIVYYFFNNILTYDNRLRGFYLSPNYLAMFLSPGLIIGLLQLFYPRLKRLREFSLKDVFDFILIIIIFISLYLTYSQGAWISVLFSLFLIINIKYLLLNFRKFIYFIFLFFIIIFLIYYVSSNLKNSTFLPSAVYTTHSSTNSRLIIWQSTLKILKDNWLWGVGPGNFQNNYLAYQKYFPPYQEWAVPQPHNLYLAFWIQSGIFGFVGFLILIIFYFEKIFLEFNNLKNTKQKKLLLTLLAIMFIILIHGFIDTPIWKNDLALIFWAIVFLS